MHELSSIDQADVILIASALASTPLTLTQLASAASLPAWRVAKLLRQCGPASADQLFSYRSSRWKLTPRGCQFFRCPTPAKPEPLPAEVLRAARNAQIRTDIRAKVAARVMAEPPAAELREVDTHLPLPTPTTHLPGTPEKLAVLEERRRLKQSLFHPDDSRVPSDHTFDLATLLSSLTVTAE
jgi:hypothetical protein